MANRNDEFKRLACELSAITVFRGVRDGRVLSALRLFLSENDGARRIELYSNFVAELFAYGYNFTEYLIDSVSEDENEYVKLRAKDLPVPAVLKRNVDNELRVFQRLAEKSAEDLRSYADYEGYLPSFETTEIDFVAEYERRIRDIKRVGYGIYASNVMFRLNDGGEIIPVKSPDRTDISELYGYEREKKTLIDNTVALIEGKPAANTLLYGDAGTGKSSSVKAVVNLLADRGVRLVELRKSELHILPKILEALRDNPLKFVIFIDDLSFNKNDDDFSALKAILEGATSVKADNTAIYVTSNRRHLIKESFSDREGDDVHLADTLQELLSLSDRFGLSILFTRPDKALYIDIVRELAASRGIKTDEETDRRAAAFALRKGGFSPRTAKQFVEGLVRNTEVNK